ncbi:4a-hydroxytetrahydrobiopterin dehydratase [Acidihalobacter prosperus]
MSDLTQRHCAPCEGGVEPLPRDQAESLLTQLHADWSLSADGKEIAREFRFSNYYETMAFVNAGAWISHREDHHPDLEVGYNRCRVRYSTHAIGGLSDNDFICAAKMDDL